MRTKTLLLAAAALAAGLATSMAQSNVYSVNVVGYVNKVLPAGQFVLIANPLDNGTNDLNSTLGALANKSQAQFWNGSSFDNYTKGGGVWPSTATPVGTGFFVKSQTDVTNTFVGDVIVGPGQSVTNALPAGAFVLVGSPIPYAGDLNDTNINLNLANKSQVQIWNGSGFDNYTRGAGVWPANPGIAVADGFFVKSQSAQDWVQSLPAN